MDLVEIWVELGFMLFTLDIDQYLDVIDFCWIAKDVWVSYLGLRYVISIGFGLLEARVPRCIN